MDDSGVVDGTGRLLRAEVDDQMTAGLSAGIGNEALGLEIRGTIEWSFAGATSVLAAEGRCQGVTCTVDRWEDEISNTITEALLQLVLPTRLRIGGVAPYLSGGLGLRSYDFGPRPEDGPWWAPYPTGGTVRDLVLGGGFAFELLGREVDLAVYDALSKYRGDTEHHVRISLGVPIRAPGGSTGGRPGTRDPQPSGR